MLSFYDRLVHGLSNRLAWRCPSDRLLALYRDNLSNHQLEAGVGTGFFIDRADRASFEQLTLTSAAIAWRDPRREARALPATVVCSESAGTDRHRA
jgi:hypothetical protein